MKPDSILSVDISRDDIHEIHEALNTIVLFSHMFESVISTEEPDYTVAHKMYNQAISSLKSKVYRFAHVPTKKSRQNGKIPH